MKLFKHIAFAITFFLLITSNLSCTKGSKTPDNDESNKTEINTPVEESEWPETDSDSEDTATAEPKEDVEETFSFPKWSYNMIIFPFDVITTETKTIEIDERLAEVKSEGANAIIVYIDEEQMYHSFVDESGFSKIKSILSYLTNKASSLNLKTILYINGLEVITKNAFDDQGNPTGIPTMAGEHPDWLQKDLNGQPIVYSMQDSGWLEPDYEDAWLSPLSGFRDFMIKRVEELCETGIDALYIDATFLPGYQSDSDSLHWGSAEQYFSNEFKKQTGLTIPGSVDFDSINFRKFLLFRHDILADYLATLASTADKSDVITFWESSTNDTDESILLGNETAVTGRKILGYSPEIEPEGNYFAAFRMAKAARELALEKPIIYLGWGDGTKKSAELEYAVALAHSNNYYPNAEIITPSNAVDFITDLNDVLENRTTYYGNIALIYSVRNKDFSYEEGAFIDAYEEATQTLFKHHIPFKILTLEYLTEDDLDDINTVILPEIIGLSDSEAALLNTKKILLYGDKTGTRNEDWGIRTNKISFQNEIDPNELTVKLPFNITATSNILIEYYTDRNLEKTMYLFVVSPDKTGNITVSGNNSENLNITKHQKDSATSSQSGKNVSIAINSYLTVLVVSQ